MIGYKFFCERNVTWRENQGGLFPLSPPFVLSDFKGFLARRIISENDCFFLRWESDFDQIIDGEWWHIIKDSYDELDSLPKKTRYMVRKAAKSYEVKPLTLHEVIENAYPVYESAYRRYNTHEPMLTYKVFCNAIAKLPKNTEFWGVFEKESQRLVGFSENYIEKKTCFYLTMWLEPESMSNFSGYLLFHEMELHYLRDCEFKYVSDGARSISHDTNIHGFLLSKFNFRRAYAKLHVVYVPWLKVAVSVSYPFRKLVSKVPFSPFRKASILLKQEEIRRASNKVSS
ncbi:hypothetical protein HXW73_05215 [Halomonas sp. SH5A2]|uniref:hypothetical protein n=1 Tax=Halomonas sp. SH5A2 TaxID=2749040 RepID=UPI00163E8805|nr:hypothetical protein [Halomonas sp. SH5A2]QNI02378.1 hypothetical protein HXW73_05215 [Halomonas sp. SH5A2]